MRTYRKGAMLIEMLVVIAIIGILTAVFINKGDFFGPSQSSRADGLGRTTLGAAKLKANDIDCKNRISQIRMSIEIGKTDDYTPPTMDDLPGIPKDYHECPIGHEQYLYDAAGGKVSCPHPGHERY